MSNVTVKVPTAKVIELVETKIAEIEKQIAEYPTAHAKWKSDYAKYQSDLEKTIIKFLPKAVEDSVSVSINQYGSLTKRISINFSIPADTKTPQPPVEPKDPNQRIWHKREHISDLERLNRTLKVLKMTTQETVNASTYNAVMDLI